MLPDRSILKGQKLVQNAQIETHKYFGRFSNTVHSDKRHQNMKGNEKVGEWKMRKWKEKSDTTPLFDALGALK